MKNRNKCSVFAGLKCQAETICCSFAKRIDVTHWKILLERVSLLNRRKKQKQTENPQTIHDWLPNLLGCHDLASQDTCLAESSSKTQNVSLLTIYRPR